MSYRYYFVPKLLQNSCLFDLEKSSGLPLRLALLSLVYCADKAGRFRWQPPDLKRFALPYDEIDFEAVMDVLADNGFLMRYSYEGYAYGLIIGPAKLYCRHNKMTTPSKFKQS